MPTKDYNGSFLIESCMAVVVTSIMLTSILRFTNSNSQNYLKMRGKWIDSTEERNSTVPECQNLLTTKGLVLTNCNYSKESGNNNSRVYLKQ